MPTTGPQGRQTIDGQPEYSGRERVGLAKRMNATQDLLAADPHARKHLFELQFIGGDSAFPFTPHMGGGRFGEIAADLGEPCAQIANGSISFRANY